MSCDVKALQGLPPCCRRELASLDDSMSPYVNVAHTVFEPLDARITTLEAFADVPFRDALDLVERTRMGNPDFTLGMMGKVSFAGFTSVANLHALAHSSGKEHCQPLIRFWRGFGSTFSAQQHR